MQVSLGGRLFCNDCSAYNCFVMSVEDIFVGKMEQPTRFLQVKAFASDTAAAQGLEWRVSGLRMRRLEANAETMKRSQGKPCSPSFALQNSPMYCFHEFLLTHKQMCLFTADFY